MKKFCLEELTDFTKEQKDKLMQFAIVDEDYIERCNTIQSEMECIDSWQIKNAARMSRVCVLCVAIL